MTNKNEALKYDKGLDKLPWDLLPFKATEGTLRVLLYGKRKYTVCGNCKTTDGKPTVIYLNPRLDGDPPRTSCPKCDSTEIVEGAHNWRKGFSWTRLVAASFRHLVAIATRDFVDNESGLPHVDHLSCMIAFLSEHQKLGYGEDDIYEDPKGK